MKANIGQPENAATPTDFFNKRDIKYLLKKLRCYHDLYTDMLRWILKRYIKHRNFRTLHQDLDALSDSSSNTSWDTGTLISFLEVIYP